MLADWITLDIPWWVIVLGYIGLAFWPLTIVAAFAGVIVWRTRATTVRILFALPLALWLISAYVNLMPIVGNLVEKAQIQRRHYVAGTGMTGDMTLVHDTVIDGILCSSKDTVHIDFLGRLTDCTLAQPQIVRGVPCIGRVSVDYRVQCTLASDYKRFGYVWRESTLVRDTGGGSVSFQIGPHPPTLAVLGSPLPENTEVTYDSGRLLSITFVDNPMHYRDCTFGQVLQNDGGFEAWCTGKARVVLPPGSLKPRGS